MMWTFVALVVKVITLAVAVPVCPTDQYYDIVTRSCTDCFNICNNAVIQRTKDECDSVCSGYQLPLNDMPAARTCTGGRYYDSIKMRCVCPKDMFFDEVTRRCSSCYDICYNAVLQKTEDACNSSCPDFQLQLQTTTPVFNSNPASGIDHHKTIVIAVVCTFGIVLFIGVAITLITVCCCRARCEGKGRDMCSALVSLLHCIPRDGRGAEPENVPLAGMERSSEVVGNQQPREPDANVKMAPSGHSVYKENEETELKV